MIRTLAAPPAYRNNLFAVAALAIASLFAGAAHAHGFGQRYDLPVPLWLYLSGAGAAVAVSFVVMAFFGRQRTRVQDYPRFNLLQWRIARVFAHPAALAASRALAMMVFVVVLVAGFCGNQTPVKNIAPLMVWAIWWVGMAYISALLGDLWALVNPVNTAYAWAESKYCRLSRSSSLSLELRYPPWLGKWPAVTLLLAFAWSELIWEQSDVPAYVAATLLVYCAITWSGMFLYGRGVWLRNGDAFTLVFGLLARFAPLEARHPAAGRELNLRPYAIGLLTDEPVAPSTLALVMLMLATVSFDGFMETPPWASLVDGLGGWLSATAPALTADTLRAVVNTLGLFAAWMLFSLIYFACAWAMTRKAGPSQKNTPTTRTACLFVLTLVPIAIAYHLAHYLSFLLMACQYMIPLLSDPFGLGWDLFGTTLYLVKIGIVDAQFIWYASVAAIVAGHIAAVYLAHAMAMRVYADRRAALRSQYPMLALMIGYTMVSLWIIAQPIVTSRFG
ncbi:MAG: hypothetical protein ABIS45_11025 [Burkholderiales bacterium]